MIKYSSKQEPKHPCNRECTNRCVGCKSKCIDLLEYKIFYAENRKKYKVGSGASIKAKISGINQSTSDKTKRKSDMEYYLKYNSKYSNTYCVM